MNKFLLNIDTNSCSSTSQTLFLWLWEANSMSSAALMTAPPGKRIALPVRVEPKVSGNPFLFAIWTFEIFGLLLVKLKQWHADVNLKGVLCEWANVLDVAALHRHFGRIGCRSSKFWRQGGAILCRLIHSYWYVRLDRDLDRLQLLTISAMATMIYALVTYHWRAAAIRRRGAGPYDDRFGPTMLCFFLLIAVVINFFLRIMSP